MCIRDSLQDVLFSGCNFGYANCNCSKWKNVSIADSSFSNADFGECSLKNLELSNVELVRVNFSHTPLAGIDFTASEIAAVSYTHLPAWLAPAKEILFMVRASCAFFRYFARGERLCC